MQAITPVDIHVDQKFDEKSNIKKTTKIPNREIRQTTRIRTKVVNKTKTKKKQSSLSSSSNVPKQTVIPKLILQDHSRSPSPYRGPWVPPPGRSTKGQKLTWQSPRSRLEINPTTEFFLNNDQHNTTINSQGNTRSIELEDTQNYEKYAGNLKDMSINNGDQEKANQFRSNIDPSLNQSEKFEENHSQRLNNRTSRSQSPSPTRSNLRSLSADQQRQKTSTIPKVSFQDDSILQRRRTRSTTPIKGPIHLNPDREHLLITLAQSEMDIAQIIKQLSTVKDVLTKLTIDDQPVSFKVEQLNRKRNELLHLIEQFEQSNSKLKAYLQQQYHFEAENGIIYNDYDQLRTHLQELANENEHIKRLLRDRENDNIALQTELERVKTHSIGFDTMKTSLEHNRAHLQRELYAKEGEINRLQCALRSLERDLQRSRYPCSSTHRSQRRTPMFLNSSYNSSPNLFNKTKPITIDKIRNEFNDYDHDIDDTNSEIIRLRSKLEEAERLANEYKAELHTQTLKSSANNTKNHLSELELEKIRMKLQERIAELEPLPQLLKDSELKNEKLQKRINELEKRSPKQTSSIDRTTENHLSSSDDVRALQRKINSLEEQNEKLLKTLNFKDDEIRLLQSRLNAKTYDPTSFPKYVEPKKPNIINREEIYGSHDRIFPTSTFDLEQQIKRLHAEYSQLKHEKDELERRFSSQLNEIREKCDQANNVNRTLQNYINSLKRTYANLFNDSLPQTLTT